MPSKKIIFFLCMHKMFKVTAETFAKNFVFVHTIKVNKTDNKSVLWIQMIDIQKKLDVKHIHDLVKKYIKDKFRTNNLTDEQIKKYKIHGSELFDGEKFMYAHEGVISCVCIKCLKSLLKHLLKTLSLFIQ